VVIWRALYQGESPTVAETKNPKILIFMMAIGNGHKIPAQSVQTALQEEYPLIETRVVESALEVGLESYEKPLLSAWRFCLKHPLPLQMIYSLTRSQFRLVSVVDALASRRLAPRIAELLEREKPDLVFCTHPTAANIIGSMKKKKSLPFPTVVLVTDAFEAHAIWLAGLCDSYIFYDKDRAQNLLAAGVREDQIAFMEFPLRQAFTQGSSNRGRTAAAHASKTRITVTMVFGGEGHGQAEKQVLALLEADLDLDLMVLCGKNETLKARLDELCAGRTNRRTHLFTRGYVDTMQDYIAATDLSMGKSGISFTFETLFYNKPFLITQTMANEAGCRDFVLQHRVGWYAPRVREQVATLRAITADRGILVEYGENCRRLGIRNGASSIADFLASQASARAGSSA